MNSDLLEAIGGDFVSCNGVMRAIVAEERIDAVLDVLMSQHPLLTSNHHDVARHFLDISLPEFTAVEEAPAIATETFTQGSLFESPKIPTPSAVNELQEDYFEYTIEYVEEEPSLTTEDFQTWRKQAQEIGRSHTHLKQIDKLQRQFEIEPGPLSDRAQQVRADDRQTWGAQVSTVISQAFHILESKGITTPDGKLFQGKIYQILGNDDRLSIQAIDRGEILRLEQGAVRSTLTHQDAARFSAHTKFLESRDVVPQPIAIER